MVLTNQYPLGNSAVVWLLSMVWLLPMIAGGLLSGVMFVRVRRQRHARRRRQAEILLRRHLAWVARQEDADRRRDAERARAEWTTVQERARERVASMAADQAKVVYWHNRAISQPSFAEQDAAEAKRDTHAEAPCGGNASVSLTDEVRELVYECIEADDEGWRRWSGSVDKDQYPRIWLGRARGGWCAAYRLVYTWEQGEIPTGWTIDHACGEKDCMDHLESVTRAENTRRRHARERGELCSQHTLSL